MSYSNTQCFWNFVGVAWLIWMPHPSSNYLWDTLYVCQMCQVVAKIWNIILQHSQQFLSVCLLCSRSLDIWIFNLVFSNFRCWHPHLLWRLLAMLRQLEMTIHQDSANTLKLTSTNIFISLEPVWEHICWKNLESYFRFEIIFNNIFYD